MKRRFPRYSRPSITAILLFTAFAVLPCGRAKAQIVDHSPGLDQGYFDMYNVNFPAAHGVFQSWLAQHPEDGLAAASDAAAYLFGEFDRLHIIDVQLFADQSRFDNRSKLTPDPAVRKAFDDRTAQAERLADAALQRNPKDARAFYTKTLVYGMRSDYALMIDKKDLAALSLTKQASAYSKQALEIDPHMYDAYLASGVENYMLSLKPAAVRWILGITGASTDKEEGIKLLKLTAGQGHYLAPFARMMLAVAALRDGNPQQARDILTKLSKQYPDNTLYDRQLARIH
jgi:tetratricopeptide (TPR) repeat protein